MTTHILPAAILATCADIADRWNVDSGQEIIAFTADQQGRRVRGILKITTCPEGFAPTGCYLRILGQDAVSFEPTPIPGADDVQMVNSLLQDAFFTQLYSQHLRGARCTVDTFVLCPADRDPLEERDPYAGLSNAEIDELQRR